MTDSEQLQSVQSVPWSEHATLEHSTRVLDV